jgi:hypothetical protein
MEIHLEAMKQSKKIFKIQSHRIENDDLINWKNQKNYLLK